MLTVKRMNNSIFHTWLTIVLWFLLCCISCCCTEWQSAVSYYHQYRPAYVFGSSRCNSIIVCNPLASMSVDKCVEACPTVSPIYPILVPKSVYCRTNTKHYCHYCARIQKCLLVVSISTISLMCPIVMRKEWFSFMITLHEKVSTSIQPYI